MGLLISEEELPVVLEASNWRAIPPCSKTTLGEGQGERRDEREDREDEDQDDGRPDQDPAGRPVRTPGAERG